MLVEQNSFGQAGANSQDQALQTWRTKATPKTPPAITGAGNGQWYPHAGDIFFCICGEF